MKAYLDNASTTPICEAAKKVILENLDEFYNPNSSYETARNVKMKVEEAREKIAELIGAESNEIYFTSGGSEANSWVMCNGFSVASNIEHHSIKSDFKINVNSNGLIDCTKFKTKIHEMKDNDFCISPSIASCMFVNNEIGVIEPIKYLAKIAHDNNMLFHSDAVQAFPHMKIDVKNLGVDMMSCSGHKFGSPKGIGFLYIKNGISVNPLINGGGQERGIRGGTTNVLGILAMAAALEYTITHMDENNAKLSCLSKKLKDNLLGVKGVTLNAIDAKTPCIESILNLRIDDVKSSDLVTMCDLYGIEISSGSACNEGTAEPSHVLKAIRLTTEQALSSIRISLSHLNTEEEIDYVSKMLPKIISRLRQ